MRDRVHSRRVCFAVIATAITSLGCGNEKPLPTPPSEPKVGEFVWRNTSVASAGRLGIDSQRAYTFGLDRVARALDLKTGQLIWSRPVALANEGTGLDVLVAGSRVLVDAGELIALDPISGEMVWRFQPPGASGSGMYLIAADDQHAFVGARNGRGHLYSIALTDGQLQWDASVYADDSTRVADPILADGVVYARFHVWRPDGVFIGGAAAVDANTGRVIWSVPLPFETPARSMITWADALDATHFFVSTDDGRVFALSRVDGQVQWVVPAASLRIDVRPLAVAGSVLIIGSSSGSVTAVRASDGSQLWQQTANRGSITPAMAVNGDQVYVTHLGGYVGAFDVQTGKLAWLVDAGFAIGSRLLGDNLFGAGPFGAAAIKVQ